MQKKQGGNLWKFRIILAAAMALACLLAVSAAGAEDWQAEARRMLDMINELRTGEDAWYWDRTDTEQIRVTGLKPLQYDAKLEEVARIRAAELSISLSHTRPDGSRCFTAFPAGNYTKAENIAAGFRSVETVFAGFAEENEPYAKQGHRRNMLQKSLTRVGLAAVEINGTVYWVQEFASGAVYKPETKTGWVQENGRYSYYKEDGTKATGWLMEHNVWYYLNSSGLMETGWQQIGGTWYYFTDSGAMVTGSRVIDGKEYIFDASGAWQENTAPAPTPVPVQTGWVNEGGKWIYYDDHGVKMTGWLKKGGDWYYLGSDGAMMTDWQKINKKWYYFSTDGVMRKEWQKIKGAWYYFNDNGEMLTGWQRIEGAWYHFTGSGVMQTGWQQISGQWYYFRSGGSMVTGRTSINGKTEVFNGDGIWQYSEIPEYDTPLSIPAPSLPVWIWQTMLKLLFSVRLF